MGGATAGIMGRTPGALGTTALEVPGAFYYRHTGGLARCLVLVTRHTKQPQHVHDRWVGDSETFKFSLTLLIRCFPADGHKDSSPLDLPSLLRKAQFSVIDMVHDAPLA